MLEVFLASPDQVLPVRLKDLRAWDMTIRLGRGRRFRTQSRRSGGGFTTGSETGRRWSGLMQKLSSFFRSLPGLLA